MGINSLRTLDADDIKRYVQGLGALAVISVAMRVAWVVDVVLQVQRAVDKAQHADSATPPPDTGAVADDPNTTKPTLDRRLVVNFAIQVSRDERQWWSPLTLVAGVHRGADLHLRLGDLRAARPASADRCAQLQRYVTCGWMFCPTSLMVSLCYGCSAEAMNV